MDGTTEEPQPEGQRINMVTAIRRVLDQELEANPKVMVFGEDVGPKGGVHAVTLGLQDKFGVGRVFDTSLNEEGIVGRAVAWRVVSPSASSSIPVHTSAFVPAAGAPAVMWAER